MFLAEVIGQVVATKKDEHMTGRKLLLLRPKLIDESTPARFRDGANTIVAIDTVGAGTGELVMFCQGSSARQAAGLKAVPVDAAVVAIVDRVDVLGHAVYRGGSPG
jgi:ethanolamine utilization protein EutN